MCAFHYVVVMDDSSSKDDLARQYCDIVRRNHTLVEQVRIVKVITRKDKPNFSVLGECNCSAISFNSSKTRLEVIKVVRS